ncbi:hypothetical protein [Streptomyces yangpuensis]|uniref:hypothetical protein n=1 Tax=Streptomyces yangpuensis TaxID=1648182 RepID=UPI003803FFBE
MSTTPMQMSEAHRYQQLRINRDAKVFTIFEGAGEIRRPVIGSALTGLPVH